MMEVNLIRRVEPPPSCDWQGTARSGIVSPRSDDQRAGHSIEICVARGHPYACPGGNRSWTSIGDTVPISRTASYGGATPGDQ